MRPHLAGEEREPAERLPGVQVEVVGHGACRECGKPTGIEHRIAWLDAQLAPAHWWLPHRRRPVTAVPTWATDGPAAREEA